MGHDHPAGANYGWDNADAEDQRDREYERLARAETLLAEVWAQAGNDAGTKRRHALTPGLRDDIRDFLGIGGKTHVG